MMRALLLVLVLMGTVWAPAQAHKPSDSYLTLDVHGTRIDGQWDIALRDLDFAIGLDHDGDGALTWDEIRSRHGLIADYALQALNLSVSAGPCKVLPGEQLIDRHTDGTYSVLRFQATCAQPVDVLNIDYTLFARLDPQHKGLLNLRHGDVTQTAIFDPLHAHQALRLAAPDRWRQFSDYVRTGAWHIWIGYDHILFLLSLLLPSVLLGARGAPSETFGESAIDVVKVVTAFTLAHSLTLVLATLSLVTLPSRLVESAIAASVVLAAMNNIFPFLGTRRATVAFAFGLVHGFGFSSVLTDLGLSQQALLPSLLGFNVGVELGQLCIVAAFLPLAFVLRRTRFYRGVLTGGSAMIAVLAVCWLIERAFDLKLTGA